MSKTKVLFRAFMPLTLYALAAVIVGCSTVGDGTTTRPSGSADPPLSGVQIWSQNCMRCHNMISPTRYGDAQWEPVVRAMRVRAGLTSDEEKAILDFLKSAD